MIKLSSVPYVGLGFVPVGVGAVLKGWDIKEDEYRDPRRLPVVNFRAMTEACPHECFHCFTDKNRRTLSLPEIKRVIDQLADAQTHAIDFVGEGEPTVDNQFFDIVEYTALRGIVPVVYTDAATKLRDKDFVRRLYESGASVCPKCDSLFNEEYQNWVVGDRVGKYFKNRNAALEMLMEQGFNRVESDGTTRLGFDMVVSKRNLSEVERTLRFCRANNLWVIFVFYLPSGRSGREDFDRSLTPDEREKDSMRSIVGAVDSDFGLHHHVWDSLATMRCIEFMHIYGDGRVSPCVGNEDVVGNVRDQSVRELEQTILARYPFLDRATFAGNCPYRHADGH